MYYYGITIGPIIETLSKAATPASLWYASYVFSTITGHLCKTLIDEMTMQGIDERDYCILAPYYKETEGYDGIGHYHDRIIFSVTREETQTILQIIQTSIHKVKSNLANTLSKNLEWLPKKNPQIYGEIETFKAQVTAYIEHYIEIHYVAVAASEVTDESPIIYLAKYLDALECHLNIHDVMAKDYFQLLFDGNAQSSNTYIRESEEVKQIVTQNENTFNLLRMKPQKENAGKQYTIRELADIASVNQETEANPQAGLLKKYRYYAIVQADGDNIGKLLKGLSQEKSKNTADPLNAINKATQEFSEKCYTYTKESAKLIKAYEGVPIYAGGDDLLFIAPIENLKGGNIFKLCQAIYGEFQNIFKEYKDKMPENAQLGVSFGISIHYRGFPLYEAFQDARDLLFNQAKKSKQSMAVKLHKASGQTVGFIARLQCDTLKQYDQVLQEFYNTTKQNERDAANNLLKGMMYQMENFHTLFEQAFITLQDSQSKDALTHLFKNLFDHESQKAKQAYIMPILQLSETIAKEVDANQLQVFLDNKVQEEATKTQINVKAQAITKLNMLTTLLRIAKFLIEGGV